MARPLIVVGRYRDGTIGQFTNIYTLIRLVTAGRIHILPASPCASLDLVPIDHVIGGLIDIAERMAAASGRTYHLVSGAPVPVAALRTLALGYQHMHAPRFVPPETFERARLTRAEQTLDRRVTSFYASYLQRDPWFQDANPRALSGRTGPRLLVGNFSTVASEINAFNLTTGAFIGMIPIDPGTGNTAGGLWDLIFGNGAMGDDPNTLYFNDGIGVVANGMPMPETHGLFAALTPAAVPEPSSLALLAAALGFLGIRRSRSRRRV